MTTLLTILGVLGLTILAWLVFGLYLAINVSKHPEIEYGKQGNKKVKEK